MERPLTSHADSGNFAPASKTSGDTTGRSQHVSYMAFACMTVLLLTSVTVNVLLGHRLQGLNRAHTARMSELQLKIGTNVPPIAAKPLTGPEQTISYQTTSQLTVLYIFTPSCVWCARNMDNLKTLIDKERDSYRFIGLSLAENGVAQYVAKNELRFPVYSGLSPATVKSYKLGSTPQTIVISPEGKVLQDWVGAYVGDQKSQVEAFFNVSLPGLRELPKAEASRN